MNPVRNHVLKNPISSGLLSLKTMKNFPKISNGVKNKIIIFVLVIGVFAAVTIFFIETRKSEENFETRREKVLSQLYSAIEQAEKEGKYECCIEPPCTMCYLGNWIWEDGACACDKMIAKGEWDKVCPQCIKGIEEGRCKSETGVCPIPEI